VTEREAEVLRTLAAWHEAGHVVAALICHIPFERVSIISSEELKREDGAGVPLEHELGYVNLIADPLKSNGIVVGEARPLSTIEVGLVRRVMVQCVAGYYAVLLRFNEPDAERHGAVDDYTTAHTLANFLSSQDPKKEPSYYVMKAELSADELMADAEDLVRTVAGALLTVGTMTQAEVLAALPGPALRKTRERFLRKQPHGYLSVEEVAFLNRWEDST
jgi:hypothetical protein